jgi:hypothetical protein
LGLTDESIGLDNDAFDKLMDWIWIQNGIVLLCGIFAVHPPVSPLLM